MNNFVLFCKSYRNDVFRAKKLLESVAQFNIDRIPFFLSVPQNDLDFFKQHIDLNELNSHECGKFTLITDEEIVLSNPKATLNDYNSLRGQLSQQVIKAEAWRFIHCKAYLCLDSDSFFIKPFYLSNFLAIDGHPYTLLHKNADLLTEAKALKKTKVLHFFVEENSKLKTEFNRHGEDLDFGPAPLLWSRDVWESLEKYHLRLKNETIWDAIRRLPFEIRWYGEALLKYQAIPIHPITPLFKVYHYSWQAKVNQTELQKNYLGVVSQSNWDKNLDPKFARKNIFSRIWKKIRSYLKRSI
jgi:hypothetical protein